jgi:adenosine deaminase
MNPVTASLTARIEDRELHEFIRLWDELEELVIDISRNGRMKPSQRAAHRSLRNTLIPVYSRWEVQLAPYRRELKIVNMQGDIDPFRQILEVSNLDDKINSRSTLEALPHARQVINHFLLDRIEKESGSADERS